MIFTGKINVIIVFLRDMKPLVMMETLFGSLAEPGDIFVINLLNGKHTKFPQCTLEALETRNRRNSMPIKMQYSFTLRVFQDLIYATAFLVEQNN